MAATESRSRKRSGGGARQRANGTAQRDTQGTAQQRRSEPARRSVNGTAERSASATAKRSASGSAKRSANGSAKRSASATAKRSASGSAKRSASGSAKRSASATAKRRASGAAKRGTNATAKRSASGTAQGRPKRQAERYAEQAKKKTDERRKAAAGGASGWVAERAGDWTLRGLDSSFMERQKYFWNPLVDYWFRMELEGWERLPEPPALLIGIHSGAPFVWDAWTVGLQWWRRFGAERPLHGTAHDALMAAPLIGSYFRKMGVLPAAPDSISAALAAGHDVALWPGGEVDSLRPWTKRDEANLAGRKGFVRTAIKAGVPIVPISTVGGPDSMPVLFRGRRLARALQLDKVARLKMFPIALSAPWGIGPALLPEIPLPTKIRTAFQEPIKLDSDPERANDDAYVDKKYEEVQASIQRGMDALARRRRLPLFG